MADTKYFEDFPGLDQVEHFVENLIKSNAYRPTCKEICLKIDLLERSLELLRIKHHHLENNVPFEEFIQGEIEGDISSLHFHAAEKLRDLGSGTQPRILQPRLLVFLLLHHRQAYRVYDIIDNYIRNIWNQLQVVDFKRTQTGVFRCFTNTRFAANTLRDYGLLKFTKQVAFKTWTLSLSGFLVASKLVQEKTWNLPEYNPDHKHDLHEKVLKATLELDTYDKFVARLAAVCEPEKDLFSTFEKVLKEANRLLTVYWKNIHDMALTQKERKEKSLFLLRQIEILPEIEDFYIEFSKYLRQEEILRSYEKLSDHGPSNQNEP